MLATRRGASRPTSPRRHLAMTALALLALATATAHTACSGSSSGSFTPTPPPVVGPDDPLPGLDIEVLAVEGASGADGSFRVGDSITVRFRIRQIDGRIVPITEIERGVALVSGPTFNYQRVIGRQSDLATRSASVGDGSYRYRITEPIPATYLPPFGGSTTGAGNLAGQELLAGTYTVGLELRKTFDIPGTTRTLRDVGNATAHFRFGGAPDLEPREVTTTENCNMCHGSMQFHGGNRNEVSNCLLCHTAGSTDDLGESLEFAVLVHKLHAGKHLPSVLGVTTRPDGSRDHNAPESPYVVGGTDYSHVGYPRYPSTAAPMPADIGHGDLSSAARAKEVAMRSGPVDCASCHGDPDADGPLPEPAQGGLAYRMPTRRACGSCHDDWVWDRPYTANQQTMPAQRDDSTCTLCHKVEGTPLDVVDAHRHPLLDPRHAKGVNITLLEVRDAGPQASGDGRIDPGDRVDLVFTVADDTGAAIDPADLRRMEVVILGPAANPNLVHHVSLTADLISRTSPHVVRLPESIPLERVGVSTAKLGEVFGTARFPHRAGVPAVHVRTGTGATSATVDPAALRQNFVDVLPATGAGFARNQIVVVDDGVAGMEEYARVRHVEGDRVWLASALRHRHGVGTTVKAITASEKQAGIDFEHDAESGRITEKVEFGEGNVVLVSYTCDFVVPEVYPPPLNDSPDLGQDAGEWRGLRLVPGTYTVGINAGRPFSVEVGSEATAYTDVARPATMQFLIGEASRVEPVDRIDSAAACNRCHVDITFHGNGRRGYESCALCHTTAGAEDRPRYVAPNAPATPRVTIDFRTMLHKIHHGRELDAGSDYRVIGFGQRFPDNFSVHTYEHVGFPGQPGGTKACVQCHGPDNEAWQQPAERLHPDQTVPTRAWAAACGSCHDSRAAQSHIDANTSPGGGEACAICHGRGRDHDVERVHIVR